MEIESTLNSRPLTYEYDEAGEEMLMPAHLIFGRRIQSMPDPSASEESDEEESRSCSDRFRYLRTRLAHFWSRWRNEYLKDLREIHCRESGKPARITEVGDVVTVHEDNKKIGNWKMDIVEKLVKGKDGVVRGAEVRVITKGRRTCIHGLCRSCTRSRLGTRAQALSSKRPHLLHRL